MIAIAKEQARLATMTAKQLRDEHAMLFGEPLSGNNKTWLMRRILWRLQAQAEGSLSERAKRLAEELADDSQLRVVPTQPLDVTTTTPILKRDPRLPAPGTILTRKYKGTLIQVKVLEEGFEYAGDQFKSLSAVTKAITGSHANGFLFFGLTGDNR